MNGRERVLALLEGRPIDHLALMPITMMLASARIGEPHGRYALDHRIQAEAQVRVAEEFGFDHVSAISETREAPDCGARIARFDDQPAAIDGSDARLAHKENLADLTMPDPLGSPHMRDRIDGVRLLKRQAGEERIVEGWVEGPCQAAADLRGISALMTDFYDDARFVRDLLAFAVELATAFGQEQIKSGADLVGVGDPASSLVGPRIYEEFVWPYERRLVTSLREAGAKVRLHICGNTAAILDQIGALGCDIVDIDSMVSLSQARREMGSSQILLGNLNPLRDLRDGSPASIQALLGKCHEQAGPRYIVGAGCEIARDTPLENLRAMAAFAQGHGRSP